MGKRPTIQMIADKAGVSRGTVDRVLNNRSYVRDSVRQRVLEAIDEVGYFSPRENYKNKLTEPSGLVPIRLGVVLPTWKDGAFYAEITRGIQNASVELQEFNVSVIIRECVTELPEEVIDQIDDLVEQGVAGISLCAVTDIAVEQKINELAKNGIPVVTFNSDLPQSKRLCFVGQDYIKSGRIAAELMSKCISPYGQVLATAGNLEFFGHRARMDGFCERMKELGFGSDQINIIETYNDYAVTRKKVHEALKQQPRIEAVYMANRSLGGCVEAIRALGKTGKIRVICHDIDETTKRLLKEGSVDMTISQDIFRQGREPLLILRDLLQKNRRPATNLINPAISIFCAENI